MGQLQRWTESGAVVAGALLSIRESQGPEDRPAERAVARLWRRAHVLADGLRTEDGRRFRVVYPGRLSGLAGPDFRDTVLETEAGELITGDVELHVDAPDWYRHGHHADPGYNGVVLHVVLHPKDALSSAQQSRTAAPVASLGPVAGLLGEAADIPADELPWTGLLRGEELGEALDRAGDQRFLAKARGFALELEHGDPDELLYRAVMEGLGYAANRRPFRRLAELVPFSALRALRGEPPSTRLLAIKAMLMHAAGLLCHVESAEERRGMRALLRHLPGTTRLAAGEWRLSRVRPSNHPARRVLGAALLADRYVRTGLVSGLAEAVAGRRAAPLVQGLSAGPYVGAGRAREIAVKAVLPFIHAWAGVPRQQNLQGSCLELYRGFPSLADNEITREMRRVLSTRDGSVEARGARRHQGLIQLYKSMTRQTQGGAGLSQRSMDASRRSIR